MNLDAEDIKWLEERFERVTRSHNEIVSSAAKDKAELVDRIQKAREMHEAKHHDLAKTWGVVAAISGIVLGMIEFVKHMFKGER